MEQPARESSTDGYVDTTVRIRYAETDLMGVVYHANYPIFFEMGRSEYMRRKGFTYRDFEATGYRLVVTALEAKYHNSATYDDVITVRTRISELQSRGLTFQYAIYKEKTLLVEGKTKHLCINNNKKPIMSGSRDLISSLIRS
ncbi:MAG TPA: thioesterase family protein [Syntrophorhabdaceae bacterium]|nr:thioesterase family protein [Syntrophorhabdaceae bacterium]